ncbi:MAG: spondin domain-containing protein [Bacteroidota bacterium]|nr:spondin domain-containing protein [Bacteroidota bacterium]
MKKIIYLAAMALLIGGCTDETTTSSPDQSRRFKVLIENVSTPNTIASPRINGTVPLSHGVYAIYASGSLFTPGQVSDEGTSRIAEDGFTTVKTNDLNNTAGIMEHGEFVAPGGPDSGAAIFAGESSMFMVKANPGEKLQIQSMFVQSNDWFYSFNGGLSLFNGTTPISGDMTSNLVLYDAGTEADEAPGTGPYQKPVQGPTQMNFGPDDAVNMITDARTRHSQLNIPATTSVIRITVTPQ